MGKFFGRLIWSGYMSKKQKESGHNGFSKEYWEKNYSEPMEMDNIGNSKEHARYLQALFDLEQIEINSMIDFGFGLGYLLEATMNEFLPIRVMGIEPSSHAYSDAKKRIKKPAEVSKFTLKNIDLVTWAKEVKSSEKCFDLGICTSVFQYLKDDEIEFVLPIMAKHVKFLYFSCPTDLEFKRQKIEYDFFDEYSIHRSKEKYLKWIRKDFTIVSSRILESKYFFNDDNSEFRETIFRY